MQQSDPLSYRKFFTKAAPALSKPSASSNDSSASRYAARRPRRTTAPSSRSPAPSSLSNPSTQPSLTGVRLDHGTDADGGRRADGLHRTRLESSPEQVAIGAAPAGGLFAAAVAPPKKTLRRRAGMLTERMTAAIDKLGTKLADAEKR